ncbi:hypothetical protein P3L10_008599 [Capsicum annuum]
MLRGCWFLHVNIGIMWYMCAISFSTSLILRIFQAKRFLAPVTALRILKQVMDTVIPLSSAMFHPSFQPEVQMQCLNDPGSASINNLEFSNSPIYSPSVQDFSIDQCNFEGGVLQRNLAWLGYTMLKIIVPKLAEEKKKQNKAGGEDIKATKAEM